MCVAHIATGLYPNSAAGRLIKAERLAGIDAIGVSQNDGDIGFPNYKNTLSSPQKIGRLWRHVLRKVLEKVFWLKKRLSGQPLPTSEYLLSHPWNDGVFGEPLHNTIKKLNVDIVHLHWIASGFPALKEIHKIDKPIVWTLHDIWPLTAGHHCEMGCTSCSIDGNNCSEFEQANSLFLSSSALWNYKRKYISKIKDLTLIAPSTWSANKARQSPLFAGRKIVEIPNAFDTNLFSVQDKKDARESLSFPLNKKIILFSSCGGTAVEYKGYHLLVEALWVLKEKMLVDDIHLVVIGPNNGKKLALPFPVSFLGYIESEKKLANIYNAADVLVCPSIYDNCPAVIREAALCGVPSVAFDVAGIPEMILHKKCGYVAKSFDTMELAGGITWVLADKERYAELSKNARKFEEDLVAFPIIAEKHRVLYEALINQEKD
jgi:glycosyltransferase involved in cell wall biosynthesis